MKEIQEPVPIEISVKHKKRNELKFIGSLCLKKGHSIWQINRETLQIEKVEFHFDTFIFGDKLKKQHTIRPGFSYVSALNKKNALKKYQKYENRSKTK